MKVNGIITSFYILCYLTHFLKCLKNVIEIKKRKKNENLKIKRKQKQRNKNEIDEEDDELTRQQHH